MKIIHIDSGLGNQMLSFAEYLVMKKNNPLDECFIENLIYDIPEVNQVVSQWNGYELEDIFGIQPRNIREIFDVETWTQIVAEMKASRFWKNGWNYNQVFINSLANRGIKLIDLHDSPQTESIGHGKQNFLPKQIEYCLKHNFKQVFMQRSIHMNLKNRKKVFIQTDENVYAGQFYTLMVQGGGIEFVDKEIRKAFQFPEITDMRNKELLAFINSVNSVAIHARRGDFTVRVDDCYKYGYYRKAVKFIKKKVSCPYFIFFSDPGSISWCKNNLETFGLSPKENIVFVDWNSGKDSFRDMQLMAKCKHNIFTHSSFGWWAGYLNENPEKITCSSSMWVNSTCHF